MIWVSLRSSFTGTQSDPGKLILEFFTLKVSFRRQTMHSCTFRFWMWCEREEPADFLIRLHSPLITSWQFEKLKDRQLALFFVERCSGHNARRTGNWRCFSWSVVQDITLERQAIGAVFRGALFITWLAKDRQLALFFVERCSGHNARRTGYWCCFSRLTFRVVSFAKFWQSSGSINNKSDSWCFCRVVNTIHFVCLKNNNNEHVIILASHWSMAKTKLWD